jgi:hypothetical protein
MSQKTYTVRFFEIRYGADGKAGSIFDFLGGQADAGQLAEAKVMGESAFQVRHLVRHQADRVDGAFVRFRNDALLVSSRDRVDERPLILGAHEEYIEKNHFIVFRERPGLELVAFQMSLEGGHPTSLASYLTQLTGGNHTVSFDDILTVDAMQRLMAGTVKAVEFRVAKPRKKSFLPDPNDTWSARAFEFMSSTGATTFSGTLAIRSPVKGLVADVKQKIQQLLGSEQTRALRVKLSGDGEAIDMLAERVHRKITVPLVDRRPDTGAILAAIAATKQDVQIQLDGYFGKGDEALE